MARRKPNILGKHRHVDAPEMADIIGCTVRTLTGYVTDGCPRSADASYDSAAVIGWLEEQARQSNPGSIGDLERLQAERIQRFVTLQDMKIASQKGQVIDVALHEQILGSRMRELRRYLTDTWPVNAEYFARKTADELRPMLNNFARRAMDAYIAGSQIIDEVPRPEITPESRPVDKPQTDGGVS